MMKHPYTEYIDTPLWRALASALGDLEASHEITIDTGRDYVIGYMCRELAAKWVIASAALTPDR